MVATALGCSVVLTVLLGNLIADVDRTVRDADTVVKQTAKDLHDTSQNANAALIQLGLATYEVQAAAREQRKYWDATARDTQRTILSMQKLIDATDANLNDGLLPHAEDVIENAGNLEKTTQSDLIALNETITELTAAVEAGRRRLEDPKIDVAGANLVTASASTAAATASLASAAKDIQVKVHQATRPASFAIKVASALLSVGAKVGAILAGVK